MMEAFEGIAVGKAFHVKSSLSTCCKANWQNIGKIKKVIVEIPKLKMGERLSLHTIEEIIACGFVNCKMTFADGYNLKRHIKSVHNKEKPHECSQFLKKFSEQGNLNNKHIEAVHNKTKPYQCSQCLKKWSRKYHLNRHIEVLHKKAKPHQCSPCSEKFSKKHSLNRHMMEVHNFEKPHHCDEQDCDEKFLELRDLRDHLRSAHGAAKLVCGVQNCAATFTLRRTLLSHKMKHHSSK